MTVIEIGVIAWIILGTACTISEINATQEMWQKAKAFGFISRMKAMWNSEGGFSKATGLFLFMLLYAIVGIVNWSDIMFNMAERMSGPFVMDFMAILSLVILLTVPMVASFITTYVITMAAIGVRRIKLLFTL